MKKGEFIYTSKRMLKEYINRYVNKENGKRITVHDVLVIGFHDESDMYRILLSVPTSEDLFYGVTYDKSKDELYSYIYRKTGKKLFGRKENI